jgi:hypothetical protein
MKEILGHFKIDSIDTVMIGKVCKTTGIISFFVKEALMFCGLDSHNKKIKDHKYEDRIKLLNENEGFRGLKVELEKKINNLELLINNYQKT